MITYNTRVLKPPHARHTIGCDTLSITPTSKDGFVGVVTIVNHFTHFVYLYPIRDHSAKELANALMSYVGNFGLVDEILSDQGSDLMSQAVADLNTWLGLKHKVALVDVHTSNVGRKLGLLSRTQNDWKAVAEYDTTLREFDPIDPVKYDFALFGLGAIEGF